MPAIIAMLSVQPDGTRDAVTYRMLHTELSLDDALNLLEAEEVNKSWQAASRRNDEAIAAIIAKRNE